MAYSFRAQSLMLVPDFDGGEHWARKAIEVAEATGATAALIHATNNLGTSLLGKDDADGHRPPASQPGAGAGEPPARRGRARQLEPVVPGHRIFPLAYEEMDRQLLEATDYARRTIPDGIFDRWNRSARGEFLLMSGRWAEAEEMLFAPRRALAEAYLQVEILSLRGCSTPGAAGTTRPRR